MTWCFEVDFLEEAQFFVSAQTDEQGGKVLIAQQVLGLNMIINHNLNLFQLVIPLKCMNANKQMLALPHVTRGCNCAAFRFSQ